MNPPEYENKETYWECMNDTKFYEPRTIPAGWDMSEFLPAYVVISPTKWLDFEDTQPNP